VIVPEREGKDFAPSYVMLDIVAVGLRVAAPRVGR
jgi:hypothetical protein